MAASGEGVLRFTAFAGAIPGAAPALTTSLTDRYCPPPGLRSPRHLPPPAFAARNCFKIQTKFTKILCNFSGRINKALNLFA